MGISDDSEDLKQGKLVFRDWFYLIYTGITSFSHAILKQNKMTQRTMMSYIQC